MKDFNRFKLSDVAEVFSGFAFKSKDLGDVGLGVIKIGNIHAGTVAQECSGHFPKDLMTHKLKRFVLQANDTLVAMTGAGSVGRVGRMRRSHETYLVNQRVGIIRPDLSKVDPNYLGHYLSQPLVERTLYALGVGAGQPNISPAQVGTTEVKLPSLPTQERIAAILSAYDDLIENNTRRIAILEEMARRLYEEWFVHFRFPGHEETEFEEDLPKGWHRGEIAETYEGLFDGPHATPSPSETGPVFLGIKNIRDAGGLDLSTIRHIAEAEYPRWTKRVVPEENDIVFTYEATLNRYALVPKGLRCCLGRRMALIRPKSHFTYFLYLHFFTADWREVVAQRTLSGATVDRIPLTSFPTFPINLPPEKLVIQFDGVVRPLIRSVENLSNKNTNLRAQRDLLLPKLVSGEIDVSDAEGALEAAE